MQGAEADGISVLFGQRRIDPTFSMKRGVPDYLAGRPISDVAADLRAGILHPDQLPINVFQNEAGQLIAINNRTLGALSEAGMKPTLLNLASPTRNQLLHLLRRHLSRAQSRGREFP